MKTFLYLIIPTFLFFGCAAQPNKKSADLVKISISNQKLYLESGGQTFKEYSVSTSKYGIGFKGRSKKTPTGNFKIIDKIGEFLPVNTNFKGCVPIKRDTGIIARIIRIYGLDKNNKNTAKRRIYIHGGRETVGRPASIGCIVLKPIEIIDLYSYVNIGTKVEISK